LGPYTVAEEDFVSGPYRESNVLLMNGKHQLIFGSKKAPHTIFIASIDWNQEYWPVAVKFSPN